jgi:hypothetical protein
MINFLIFSELSKVTLLKRAVFYNINRPQIREIFIDELNCIEPVDKDSLEKFLSKVKFTNNITDCWGWQGYLDKRGYGTFWNALYQKTMKSHRLFYYLINNLIIDEDCLHKCDNPPCVNPFHIYEGADLENSRDKKERGREVILRNEDHGMCYISNDLARQICLEIDTVDNLSIKYNIPRSTICDIRRKKIRKEATYDITVKYPLSKSNKLNFEIAEEIRDKYSTGKYYQSQLMDEYSVSRSTIYEILHNTRFRRET